MRVFGIFTGFLAICLLISALLYYPLHLLFDGVLYASTPKQIPWVAKLIAIPGFFLLIKLLGMYNRNELGFGLPRPIFLQKLRTGWFYGVAILVFLSVMLVGLGIRAPDPIGSNFLSHLIRTPIMGLIGGLLVGLIEETFFRGAMYRGIRRRSTAFAAITLTSLLYASVHFIEAPQTSEAIEWSSGLQILWGSFFRFGEGPTFSSFIALFAVGAFLGLVREHTGNIAYCMGLHAGWVFVIKCTKQFTSADSYSQWSFLIGGYDGITGYLAAGWIALLMFLYWLYIRKTSKTQAAQ